MSLRPAQLGVVIATLSLASVAAGQDDEDSAPAPPPLQIDYFSYGAAVSADVLAAPGATCSQPEGEQVPCILGSGGGLALRGGYRSASGWYAGGAYQLSKTDSGNLYRLATMQQLRAEMRYAFDLGYRTSPYATWGLGAVLYGNEFGVETGGGSGYFGVGFEQQISHIASFGMALVYQPVVFAPFTDTAAFERSAGLAQFVHLELNIEIRSELSRGELSTGKSVYRGWW